MKFAILLFLALTARAATHPSFEQPTEVPGSPRILVLGDSISMGYTLPLRHLMGERANVLRPAENCRSSRHLRQRLDEYLCSAKWDMIQFNCGLHDLVAIGPDGKGLAFSAGGTIQVPLAEYRDNLEWIALRLKRTGAALFWVSTTPVGATPFRRQADVVRYNAEALAVMNRHGIPVIDLHAYVLDGIDRGALQWSDGVHFPEASSRTIASFLCQHLKPALRIP
jgi:hypothetical protein